MKTQGQFEKLFGLTFAAILAVLGASQNAVAVSSPKITFEGVVQAIYPHRVVVRDSDDKIFRVSRSQIKDAESLSAGQPVKVEMDRQTYLDRRAASVKPKSVGG